VLKFYFAHAVYRVFSCILHFVGSLALSPVLLSIDLGSPLFFQFSVMGTGAGFFLAGRAPDWIASRAGS